MNAYISHSNIFKTDNFHLSRLVALTTVPSPLFERRVLLAIELEGFISFIFTR